MSNICLRCNKPVYAAEELLAGGNKWHKVCFKCNLCGKRLDSTNVNAHDNALWCKQCYGRKFGPKGENLIEFFMYSNFQIIFLSNSSFIFYSMATGYGFGGGK
mgnify:CR=1 FL=1